MEELCWWICICSRPWELTWYSDQALQLWIYRCESPWQFWRPWLIFRVTPLSSYKTTLNQQLKAQKRQKMKCTAISQRCICCWLSCVVFLSSAWNRRGMTGQRNSVDESPAAVPAQNAMSALWLTADCISRSAQLLLSRDKWRNWTRLEWSRLEFSQHAQFPMEQISKKKRKMTNAIYTCSWWWIGWCCLTQQSKQNQPLSHQPNRR